MAILEGDIAIMASQVLDDVPEGGGAATGDEIADGVSNNLFPDISELDRVYGRVQLRKVFPSVRTEDTDRYSGANVIVVDPPDDPDVSCVLFTTEDPFDERTQAAGRIEAYLAQGPAYQGLLYANHIAGQMTVTTIQRVGSILPSVGETLVLRKNEGLVSEEEQYVRITDIESEVATFTDEHGDFQRLIVTLSISDQLRVDFPGFEAARIDVGINYTGKTRIYDTVVADAARYYGVTPLAEAAAFGDYVVQAEGIFTSLVPSSRTETPVADARMNQQSAALFAAGGAVSESLIATFTSTQGMYVGGGITPGTLSVARGGITLTDDSGRLMNSGTAVGTVDYGSGALALSTDVWSGSGTFAVTYTPSSAAAAVTEGMGIKVDIANQRLNWVVTLDPIPTRGSLQVSYLAQGRWYVLTDSGTGALRGADSAYGAGTINFTTGTATVTLGALPDVGSSVIYSWAAEVVSTPLDTSSLGLGARFAKEINLGRAIKPGSITISWTDSGAKEATDLNGGLIGDATGRVYYANGRIFVSPNVLPAPGTALTVEITESLKVEDEIAAFSDGGAAWTTTLAAPVREGSVEMSVAAQHPVRGYPGIDVTPTVLLRVTDNGAGALQVANLSGNLTVGSIDYVTGAVTITKSVSGYQSVQGSWLEVAGPPVRIVYQGEVVRTLALTMLNGPGAETPLRPSWAWWTGDQTDAAIVQYAGADDAGDTVAATFDTLVLAASDDLVEHSPGRVFTGNIMRTA